MEDLYLKKLSEIEKEVWVEFWEDFYITKNINETRWQGIQGTNWSGKLHWLNSEENGPSELTIYALMEKEKMVGRLSLYLKPEILPKDKHDGSHISYWIMPSRRNQGYGTEILHLGIKKCHEAGLKEVIVSCLEENIGSAKIIENNRGVLVSIEPDVFEKDKMLKTYKIDVEASLKSTKFQKQK